MMFPKQWTKYAADGGASGTGETPAAQGDSAANADAQDAARTWETILATLPDEDRALYEQHTAGLRNTVQATRQERDTLKARVDALVSALDGKEPAAVKQQLTELQTELATANLRATFYEEAGKPEIGCRNAKLAFMVAQAEKLFDRRGNPDWPAIRAAAPELFGPAVPPGNAGHGTGSAPPGRISMNEYIRQRAGR